jgi:hypothetical protein
MMGDQHNSCQRHPGWMPCFCGSHDRAGLSSDSNDSVNLGVEAAVEMPGHDRLDTMFSTREDFMRAMREARPGTYPSDWPVDVTQKESQRLCRDLARCGVEEVFEAIQHFRNSKSHRNTDVTEFDRDAVLEEMVDAFNYFFSMLILMGFSSSELYDMFIKKDRIIHERLSSGY